MALLLRFIQKLKSNRSRNENLAFQPVNTYRITHLAQHNSIQLGTFKLVTYLHKRKTIKLKSTQRL